VQSEIEGVKKRAKEFEKGQKKRKGGKKRRNHKWKVFVSPHCTTKVQKTLGSLVPGKRGK